jgi:hypothetical protein
MNNYIVVDSYLSSEGIMTNVRTNSISTLESAARNSNVLNGDETLINTEKGFKSSLSPNVVFYEIKRYLDAHLGEENYTTSNNIEFNW